MLDIKRMRFPLDIILVCIRWYAAYPLSYRHLEEMMAERGVSVDHSVLIRLSPRPTRCSGSGFCGSERGNGKSPRSSTSIATLAPV